MLRTTHSPSVMLGSNSPNLFPSVQPFPDPGGHYFPAELLHEIITLTLGQYLTDILVAPVSTRSWDAIGTLLHVNSHFRCFTLRVLDPLWGGTFKSGQNQNYTHTVEYLRRIAEHAQTNPRGVLPPARHVLYMWRDMIPYERLGRYFVVHLARVNACLTRAADKPETRFELLDMSDLTQGFYTLPNGLRHHMFPAFADYVDNILVWIRVIVFRALVIEADRLVDPARFSQGDSISLERSRAESKLCEARQYMQRMRDIAKSVGREKDDSECAVLSRDPTSRNLFAKLLPKIRRAQTQGGSSEVICNTWMSALGVLLTSEERGTYGIPSGVD